MKRLKSLTTIFCMLFVGNFSTSFAADLTLDISYYYYEEQNFMDDTSDPVLYTAGSRNWEIASELVDTWQLLYTAEVTRGWVNYSGSGRLDKDYYKFRGETYAGYRWDNLTPIIGLGYRWLYDDSGGKTSSTGALGYDRQSQYFYMPAGGIFDLDQGIKIKGQFNYLITGKQTSFLSDVEGFSDVENDQSSGWGVDFTVDYKITDNTSFYSFYRYWNIEKSDTSVGSFPGVLIFEAFEPANKTTEAGIGIAYKF